MIKLFISSESHKSLRDDYGVSTEKLDYLVEEINKIEGVLGARLMGAGFGGNVISIVKDTELDNIIKNIGEKYINKFNDAADFICCKPSDGAKKINF